jgi:hypothetical protein
VEEVVGEKSPIPFYSWQHRRHITASPLLVVQFFDHLTLVCLQAILSLHVIRLHSHRQRLPKKQDSHCRHVMHTDVQMSHRHQNANHGIENITGEKAANAAGDFSQSQSEEQNACMKRLTVNPHHTSIRCDTHSLLRDAFFWANDVKERSSHNELD